MLKLLGHYNARAKKVQLPSDRVSPGLSSSLVGIVDNDAQMRLEIYYGLADQAAAGRVISAASSAGKRHIKPGQPQYTELCDLVLQLESPEVYRKASSHAIAGGYQIEQGHLQRIVDAAKAGYFAYLFLQNEFSRPSRRMKVVHVGVDLVFRKKL